MLNYSMVPGCPTVVSRRSVSILEICVDFPKIDTDLVGIFKRFVLRAQEELGAHLWICFRSRMIFQKNDSEKKILIFFRRDNFWDCHRNSSNCNFGGQNRKIANFQKKYLVFEKKVETNANFKNPFDEVVENTICWTRAEGELQRSSDGFSKSPGTIFWICVEL